MREVSHFLFCFFLFSTKIEVKLKYSCKKLDIIKITKNIWVIKMDSTLKSPYENRIFTIPNLLSLCRLLMIPVLVWLYYFKNNYKATLILLVVSGMTDIIDGFIARRFNMVSNFGKVFDPIADKLTQAVMLFCLVTRFSFMLLPFVVLVIKETVAAVVGIITIKSSGKVNSAKWHGKVATASLYTLIGVHILWYEIPVSVSFVFISITTALMLFSSVAYTLFNEKIIRSCIKEK